MVGVGRNLNKIHNIIIIEWSQNEWQSRGSHIGDYCFYKARIRTEGSCSWKRKKVCAKVEYLKNLEMRFVTRYNYHRRNHCATFSQYFSIAYFHCTWILADMLIYLHCMIKFIILCYDRKKSQRVFADWRKAAQQRKLHRSKPKETQC